jgi:hypothetical protein
VKSIEGGHVRQQAIDEPVGPENQRIKHASVAEIEPFTIDMGLAGSGDIIRWIQASWRKEFNRRNGQITHANFDLNRTYEHEFFDALISEATFPALDTLAKEAAFMKVKILPERVVSKKKQSDTKLGGTVTQKQKLWSPNRFRLSIDGIDEMIHTNKIEAFTIKQGVKKFYIGEDRFPQIEPTKVEFPNLIGTISMEFADKLFDWYDDYVVKGQNDKDAQKTGSIEFLGPQQDKKTLFTINLYEVGLLNVQITQSAGNADQIKRVKFEMYVGKMDISGTGNLGLE